MRVRSTVTLILLSALLSGATCSGGLWDGKGKVLTFIARPDGATGASLLQTDLKTGAQRTLSGELVAGGTVQAAFDVDHKHKHIVYTADEDIDDHFELFSADVKTGEAIKLNDETMVSELGIQQAFDVDRKGRYVAYIVDQNEQNVPELFRSDLTTGNNLKLNAELPPGGGVNFVMGEPKSRYAIFVADGDVDERFEIYRSDLVTGEELKLNGAMLMAGDVDSVVGVDSKGKYVVYIADEDTDEQFELFRSDIATGSRLHLNSGLALGGDVTSAFLDPKGKYVIYRADGDEDEKFELYRADLKTGDVVKLSPALDSINDVEPDVKIDRTGKYVVYMTGPLDPEDGQIPVRLQRTDIKTGATIELTTEVAVGAGGVVSFDYLDPKGKYAIYRSEQDTLNEVDLYRADLKTGANLKLNDPIVAGGAILNVYDVDPKGRFVVFTGDIAVDDRNQLFVSDLKTGQMRTGSGPTHTDNDFLQVKPASTKGQYILYLADQDEDEVYELYRTELATAEHRKLSGVRVTDGDVLDIFDVDPKGKFVIYAADQNVDNQVELFQVELAVGAGLHAVSGELDAGGTVIVNNF